MSYEPALGPVDFAPHLDFIRWIVVGGESGSEARPFHLDWARDVRYQCENRRENHGVALFFKQLGANPFEASRFSHHFGDRIKLKDSKGGDLDEFPAGLRVREFPKARG